jgi:internalin A
MVPVADGHTIALARIADETKNRTGFLDLGRLGLTEVPEELFELEHLRGLNWGAYWVDEQGKAREAASDLVPNLHADLLLALHRFPRLTLASLSGTNVTDLSPLSGLSSLQSLNCSSTKVGDLSPLAGLCSLRSLNFSFTKVSDLSPLAGLNSLQSLYFADNQVQDLSALAGLGALQTLHWCDRARQEEDKAMTPSRAVVGAISIVA